MRPETENNLRNTAERLKGLSSEEIRKFSRTLMHNFQDKKIDITLNFVNLGNQLKEFADCNFNVWREIYNTLKGMSDNDFKRIMTDDVRNSDTFTAFLGYLRKGLIPLGHNYKGPIKESYFFYDLTRQEFLTQCTEEEINPSGGNCGGDVINPLHLGTYANAGLIDIYCLDPRIVLNYIA